MSKEIVVNVADEQTRIALVEDKKLVELYIENAENKRTIGNIYLGKIRKVMPSIQAAFVDIGEDQDAFLHFSDLSDNLPQLLEFLKRNKPRVEKVDLPDDNGKNSGRPPSSRLRRGQEILVQVTKEPIASKGSRITTDLSMAGRFLVLVPLQHTVAISRKITSQKERRRLKALASSLVPEGFGVIVRTVAEGRDAKSLDKDLKLLMERWRRIEKQLKGRTSAPARVHEDVDMASSIIRDQFSEEYDRILVDHKPLFHSIRSYVRAVAPKMASRVEYHDGDAPIFRAAGIQRGADRAFKDRVELPSGAYLFIERTEAMHVIDVNSGRSGRGKSHSENSLHVNLEAARVIAEQVRLRDLGGIIVVDFIDLRDKSDRDRVYEEVRKGFADDRAVTKVLPMSKFGVLQITRERLRPSITTTFASPSETDDEGDDAAKLERAEREIDRLEQRLQQREAEVRDLKEQQATEAADTGPSAAGDDGEVRALKQHVNTLEQKLDTAQRKQKKAEAKARKAQAEARKATSEAKKANERAETAADRAPAPSPRKDETPTGEAAIAPETLISDIEQWIASHKSERRAITLRVHPFTAAYLHRPVPSYPTRWFMEYLVRVHLDTDASMAPLSYHVVDTRTGQSLAEVA